MSQTTTQKLEKTLIKTSEMEEGDVFSEESHYVYLGKAGDKYQFKHLESGVVVDFGEKYVTDLLVTADQYDENKEMEVGLEDKMWTQKQIDDAKKAGTLEADSTIRVGDLKLKGIRSLWTDIHTTKVFTVAFDKKGKELTKKAFNAARDKQVKDTLDAIGTGKLTLEDAFKMIQENPVVPTEKGEERILRGYKVQFTSPNGYYDVVDMDIEDPEGKGANLRKVNINEIKYLVVDGHKYNVA